MTALHEALLKRDVSEIRRLIAAGHDVNACDSYGSRPLISAIKLKAYEIAMALIKSGADVCAKDDVGETSLYHAALLGQQDIVEEILNRAGCGRFDMLSESDLSMIKNGNGSAPIVDRLTEYGFNFPEW